MSTASSRAADRARIAEIEAQILSLRDSIQVLEAEKMCAQERLDSYTYPVLTLPNEITSEIFTKFIPAYPFPPPFVGPLSPTILTHICRKWREIALATPALWRAISLPYSEDKDSLHWKHKDSLHCLLKSWLSRSGCLPLSLEVEDIWATLDDKDVEALVLHCARWEYVRLAVDGDVAHTIQGPMPLLRQVEIRVDSCGDEAIPMRFREAPRLRSLTFPEYYKLSDETFPWAQLTSLTLVGYSLHDCAAALQHTPNLIHCHVAPCASDELDGPMPQVRLALLESLVFTDFLDTYESMAQDLECLITPSLRTFDIPEILLLPDPVHALGVFISYTGCHLQGLCITGPLRISQEVYRQAFPDIPELSFDKSLLDHDSYSEKLDQRRYVVL
ncbi:hypothetical protein B0H12DRAFT_1329065 [Mycena haematopus]|nr:hypothetical protein B0H12DRAFT_1329065 [Mycena haematopus]